MELNDPLCHATLSCLGLLMDRVEQHQPEWESIIFFLHVASTQPGGAIAQPCEDVSDSKCKLDQITTLIYEYDDKDYRQNVVWDLSFLFAFFPFALSLSISVSLLRK